MDAAAPQWPRPAADSNCLGGPDVLPNPATAGALLASDASAHQWHEHASPAAAAQSSQAAAARFVPQPGEPRSDPPPARRYSQPENGGHLRANDRSTRHWRPVSESVAMDQIGAASAPPTAPLEAQGAPEDRGQWHQQNDVDAEIIRPLSREFPPSATGNQGPPVPPTEPRPPCGPGCVSGRWWPCVPSRKSHHGPPAG